MKKTQCILVAALLLLAACAPKEGEFAEPRFRKVEHRDFTILGEELMLSVVGGEAAWRGHLILLSDDRATRNNIHIYSKRTGAWELSALPVGRAAGEISLATDIQVMGDTLYVFDNNPPRLKKYLLPALLAREPMSEVFLGEIPMSDRTMRRGSCGPGRTVRSPRMMPIRTRTESSSGTSIPRPTLISPFLRTAANWSCRPPGAAPWSCSASRTGRLSGSIACIGSIPNSSRASPLQRPA